MNTDNTTFKVKKFAIIILAAGSSSRLAQPKQLLAYHGKTLLQHSIDSAKKTDASDILVVLGSGKDIIEKEIDRQEITIVENPDWEDGIASTIKAGIEALKTISPDIDAIIFMVCDQPFADAEILHKIIDTQRKTGKAIVGCIYDDTKGIPALFHSSLFPQLLSLSGDHGAKKLFNKYKNLATFVSFKDGGIDIDTSTDYKNLPK